MGRDVANEFTGVYWVPLYVALEGEFWDGLANPQRRISIRRSMSIRGIKACIDCLSCMLEINYGYALGMRRTLIDLNKKEFREKLRASRK